MTTFGWKRKSGGKVSKASTRAFLSDAKDEEDAAITSGDVDWLTLVPQKKAMVLEDAVAKSNRLREEGIVLAENERFWEALRTWDQALQLTPESERLMDMKAQAYLQLNEVHPAVQAAERTVQLNPRWWVGHQTLGRARLGLGEVRMALKCFSRAIHLQPDESELWEEDLKWSAELVSRKTAIEKEALAAAEAETLKIVELDKTELTDSTPSEVTENSSGHHSVQSVRMSSSVVGDNEQNNLGQTAAVLKNLPNHFVVMRD